MVQNLSSASSSLQGSINRVGTTDNGRVIYQVSDADGNYTGKLSVNQNQADVFEKTYHDLMESAPAMEKFAKEHQSEESLKKLNKKASTITLTSSIVGALLGVFTASKLKIHNTWAQIGIALPTTIAGMFAGRKITEAVIVPSGVKKFKQATYNLSKIDVQPIE